jgi:hypothetical protein
MNGSEIAAIVAGAVWLGVLTLVTVLVVRQIALLTARLDHVGAFGPPAKLSLEDEGPRIGIRVDETVLRWVPELGAARAHLLLLSAGCSPCRDFAADLRGEHLPIGRPVVVLIPGREELADGIAQMLPATVTIVRDPNATDVAQLLRMQRVPSAVTTANGIVTAKILTLDSVDQFQQFVESSGAPATSNGREALAAKGVEHGR